MTYIHQVFEFYTITFFYSFSKGSSKSSGIGTRSSDSSRTPYMRSNSHGHHHHHGHYGGPRNGLIVSAANEAIEAIHHKMDRLNDDVTPPRSPLVVQNAKHLLLRPSDNR